MRCLCFRGVSNYVSGSLQGLHWFGLSNMIAIGSEATQSVGSLLGAFRCAP